MMESSVEESPKSECHEPLTWCRCDSLMLMAFWSEKPIGMLKPAQTDKSGEEMSIVPAPKNVLSLQTFILFSESSWGSTGASPHA